jgi:hypothetical protein
MGCSDRACKDQIDPVMTAMAVSPQEDRLMSEDGMPYLLDQIRRAGAIVAEGGLEQASFVAAARMSWVEHVSISLRSSMSARCAFFRIGMAIRGIAATSSPDDV